MKRVLANRFDAAVAAYISSSSQHPPRKENEHVYTSAEGNGNRLILVVKRELHSNTEIVLLDF